LRSPCERKRKVTSEERKDDRDMEDMSAKYVQRFFEWVASDWDTMRLAYYDERVIEKMAEVSGIGEASEVADVGTGTGFVAAGIAPRVKRVVGVDNAPAMLEVARENLRALGASNVDLVVGEVTRLPLEDGTVEASGCFRPLKLTPCQP
jgi:ubiquinone/menaquinone biosynthesis C-methylase UbiE